MPSRQRQRRWNGQRFDQLNKAVNPNFASMAALAPGGIEPRAFPLMDAINAATGEITANGGVYGSFMALPRDPRDDNAFGPMDPLRPEAIDLLDSDGRTEPRSWQYPVGWNLPGNGNRETPWAVLRAASLGVGIIRRCIEARKKDVSDLNFVFAPSEDAINDAYQKNPGAGRLDAEQKLREELMPDINRLRAFWEKPCRSRSWDFLQWCRAVLEHVLVDDAVPLWARKTYGGDVYDIQVIDPSTIKPLLDVQGNQPLPPFPAYQQVLYGFPRGEWAATVEYNDDGNAVLSNGYLSSQMMYYVANPRTYSPFGLSPVEQALFDSRLYLQRQKWMLAEYDDGSTPLTWIETAAPSDGQQMTLTQQRLWEQAFNAKLAGNTRQRARAKVLPNGWKAMQMASVDERYRPEYDLYLIKLLASHFGVTATRLGFGETNGLGGSGFAESQMAVTGELGLKPDTEVLTAIINEASCHFLGMDKRIKGIFVDPSDSNSAEQATITVGQINSAQISVNEARQKLGQSLLPFEEANMPFILGGPQGMMFLEGAKKAIETATAATQMQAETAALGTAGKLSLDEKKLDDGKEARKETHELARETRDVTLEAQREQNEIKKSAEIKAFRTWRAKPANAGDQPRRPFVFKSVEPDDGWPELDDLGPLVAEFDGWEWMWDETIEKAAKGSGLTYLEWNVLHPNRPKGPNGRWVKSGSTLAEALRDEAKRHAEATGAPSGASTSVKPMDKPKVPRREGKTKRGDLIVVEQKHPDFKGRTEYPVFQVTSVTREGAPRMMQELGWESASLAVDRFLGLDMQRSHTIPSEEVDVDAIKAKLKAHTYPNSDTPRTYEDLKSLRDEVLLPHVKGATPEPVKPSALSPAMERALRERADNGALEGAPSTLEALERLGMAQRGPSGLYRATPHGIKHIGAPDATADARARQLRIDAVKPRAEFLADVEEGINTGADSATLRRMTEQSVRRNNLADDPVAGHVQLNMDSSSLNTAAAAWGLRRIGDEGSFNPAMHRPVGERPSMGGDVELVRPGYVFRDSDGADIQLMRAVVDAKISEPEPGFGGMSRSELDAMIQAGDDDALSWIGEKGGKVRTTSINPRIYERLEAAGLITVRDARRGALKGSYMDKQYSEHRRLLTLTDAGRVKLAGEPETPALDKPGIDSAGFVTSPMNAHSLGRGDEIILKGERYSVVGVRRDGLVVMLTAKTTSGGMRTFNLGVNDPIQRITGGNLRKAAKRKGHDGWKGQARDPGGEDGGQWVSGPGNFAERLARAATGQAALDAVPAKLKRAPRGHFGDYEGEGLDAPAGAGSARALSEYEGPEYQKINTWLRGGYRDHKRERWHTDEQWAEHDARNREFVARMEAETEPRIAEIRKTMKVSPLAGDVRVERVVTHGKETFGREAFYGELDIERYTPEEDPGFKLSDELYDRWISGERPSLVGARFRNKGFESTTADPAVVPQFGERWARMFKESPNYSGEPIIMTMIVPKGTGAVQLAEMGHAAEILFETDLEHEVVADHGIGEDGFRRIDVWVTRGYDDAGQR